MRFFAWPSFVGLPGWLLRALPVCIFIFFCVFLFLFFVHVFVCALFLYHYRVWAARTSGSVPHWQKVLEAIFFGTACGLPFKLHIRTGKLEQHESSSSRTNSWDHLQGDHSRE